MKDQWGHEVVDSGTQRLRARLAEVEARHKKLEVALQKIEDKDSSTRRGLWTYGPFGKIAREALSKQEDNDGNLYRAEHEVLNVFKGA